MGSSCVTPYWKISGLHALDSNPIVHIPSIRGTIPQVIVTVLQNSLREDGGRGGSWNHGGGGRRHCW